MGDEGWPETILRRLLPPAIAVALAALVATSGAGQRPATAVPVVHGHDMLDIVSPWWMAVLSKALAHPVMWLAVLAGAAALLALAVRGGVRAALAAGSVWLAANLTVQAVKHGLVPLAPGVGAPQLSGHTAVAAGAALLLALAAPARLRRATALATGAAVALIGVGVVVVGWHTPAQAVVPVLLTWAWAALLHPWALGPDPQADRRRATPARFALGRPAGERAASGRNPPSAMSDLRDLP